VQIRTSDGRVLVRALDFPKGDPRNPLTDEEIMIKLRALADGVARPEQIARMAEAVARADEIDDVQELTAAFSMAS
jgi:2-methylcitrate dehydratase